MKITYWVAEFTNDRAMVSHDWTRAASASNAAKYFERQYGGVVYWVEGPFASDDEATAYLTKRELTEGVK